MKMPRLNVQRVLELFFDGAYHQDGKFFHPTFRKGYRKMATNDMLIWGAMIRLRKIDRLIWEDGLVKAIIY
jgi:hypothetical protein